MNQLAHLIRRHPIVYPNRNAQFLGLHVSMIHTISVPCQTWMKKTPSDRVLPQCPTSQTFCKDLFWRLFYWTSLTPGFWLTGPSQLSVTIVRCTPMRSGVRIFLQRILVEPLIKHSAPYRPFEVRHNPIHFDMKTFLNETLRFTLWGLLQSLFVSVSSII